MVRLVIDGEAIKTRRLQRVMSREELVAKSGVGYSTIANLESGYSTTATPETIRKIARVLRVSPEKLARVERTSVC